MKFDLENGKEFIIEASDLTDENIYIKTASLNEHVYPNSFITHQTIMDGGLLRFEMCDFGKWESAKMRKKESESDAAVQ